MTKLLLEHLRKPYGILLPPAALLCFFLLMLWGVRSLGLESVEAHRAELAAQWAQVRKDHQHHQAARRAKKDEGIVSHERSGFILQKESVRQALSSRAKSRSP